ncbi:MAG: hypothetical protein HY513_03815 [Candidatus Aenigmarchaeota archaeon]|nr:hypothetical protein [Candidatus Aenigmarchaeota archaeon]
MFGIVTKLLLHKQLVFDKGRIQIFGRYSSLLPSDAFVNIQKELEQINKENIIYFSGKYSGKLWFIEMNKVFKIKSRDVIKLGSDIVTLAGWGEAVPKKDDAKNKTVIFNLNNSIVAKFHGKSNYAIDHFFRGLLCGAMCVIFKTDMDAIETACVAKGDRKCEFVVKPSKSFDFSDPIVKKQLKP